MPFILTNADFTFRENALEKVKSLRRFGAPIAFPFYRLVACRSGLRNHRHRVEFFRTGARRTGRTDAFSQYAVLRDAAHLSRPSCTTSLVCRGRRLLIGRGILSFIRLYH